MIRRGRPIRTVIVGAAGRDFHDFNVLFREDPEFVVVAFTAAQIPGIEGRRYPPALAGPLYPQGIPIVAETELEAVCRRESVGSVVFAYSDVSHEHVMHVASRALAVGADFSLPGPASTMLRSQRPVIAVTAVRTGCGKSQVSRYVAEVVLRRGLRPAVVRHPMPYGDLEAMRVQRFATMADIDRAGPTAEEREEYEPHVARGAVVFAGVDYGEVLAAAEAEADVIIWDGGNNDFSFFRPDLHIVVMDALRPGHASRYHPGEAVLRTADVVVVNKVNAASREQTARVMAEAAALAPRGVPLLRARSPVYLDDDAAVEGRRTLVIEDGPTITHGGMPHGAGFRAALAHGARVIDPRASAPPLLRRVYDEYPHIGPVLPAVGYDPDQLAALSETIEGSEAEVVVSGTPADLTRLLRISKPVVRARYRHADDEGSDLGAVVGTFLDRAMQQARR